MYIYPYTSSVRLSLITNIATLAKHFTLLLSQLISLISVFPLFYSEYFKLFIESIALTKIYQTPTINPALLRLVQNNPIVLFFEPFHSFFPCYFMRITNSASLRLSPTHTTSGTCQLHIKIHTKDTCIRIILNTEINVFLNSKAKVSRLRKVSLY